MPVSLVSVDLIEDTGTGQRETGAPQAILAYTMGHGDIYINNDGTTSKALSSASTRPSLHDAAGDHGALLTRNLATIPLDQFGGMQPGCNRTALQGSVRAVRTRMTCDTSASVMKICCRDFDYPMRR